MYCCHLIYIGYCRRFPLYLFFPTHTHKKNCRSISYFSSIPCTYFFVYDAHICLFLDIPCSNTSGYHAHIWLFHHIPCTVSSPYHAHISLFHHRPCMYTSAHYAYRRLILYISCMSPFFFYADICGVASLHPHPPKSRLGLDY